MRGAGHGRGKLGTQSQCSGTAQMDRVRREVGVGFRIGGIHVYLWLIHVDVWQKLTIL